MVLRGNVKMRVTIFYSGAQQGKVVGFSRKCSPDCTLKGRDSRLKAKNLTFLPRPPSMHPHLFPPRRYFIIYSDDSPFPRGQSKLLLGLPRLVAETLSFVLILVIARKQINFMSQTLPSEKIDSNRWHKTAV